MITTPGTETPGIKAYHLPILHWLAMLAETDFSGPSLTALIEYNNPNPAPDPDLLVSQLTHVAARAAGHMPAILGLVSDMAAQIATLTAQRDAAETALRNARAGRPELVWCELVNAPAH